MFDIGEIAKNVMKRDGTGTAALVSMFENSSVEFVQQGSFTIAMLAVHVRKIDGVTAIRIIPGVAKRDTGDIPNPKRGRMLALSRAIRNAIEDLTVHGEA